jgi:hypothetical protein
MNGTTQIINLAAGYLGPELRCRRISGWRDLVELIRSLVALVGQIGAVIVFATLHDLGMRFAWTEYRTVIRNLDPIRFLSRLSIGQNPDPVFRCWSSTNTASLSEKSNQSPWFARIARVVVDQPGLARPDGYRLGLFELPEALFV